MTLPKPDPTRRNEHSRRAILDAAVALMSDLGYDQTSIEALAKRTGVGKPTIYRWWPSKGAVALEALDESLGTVVDFADTGDIAADLRTHMTGVTNLLSSTKLGPVVQGLIVTAQSGRAISRAHLEKVIEPASTFWLARITGAQASGEWRADHHRTVLRGNVLPAAGQHSALPIRVDRRRSGHRVPRTAQRQACRATCVSGHPNCVHVMPGRT